jgi:hypothetical protein
MERKNTERHVLLHHADDALFHHPHELHMLGYAAWPELVHACPDREQNLKIAVSLYFLRCCPCQEIANAIGGHRVSPLRELSLGQLSSEDLPEDSAALRV